MKKINSNISNHIINIKKNTIKKTFKINQKYFSIELIPYNKILSNIMKHLQKKLSSNLFNEIYKYFINEVKKYINITSYKNLKTKDNMNKRINLIKNSLNGNKRPIITDFYINNFDGGHKTKLLNIKNNPTKKSKPLVGLSYSYKLDFLNTKKAINSSSFSSLNLNNLDSHFNYKKKINSKNKTLDKTISNSNSNSKEKEIFSVENKNVKRQKKIYLNNFKLITNDKIQHDNTNLYNSYNTINTSNYKNKKMSNAKIKKNSKKKNKEYNSQHISNNIKKKISTNKTLSNIPHQTFKGLLNKNNQHNINKLKISKNSNLRNAVTTFNKYKNNSNFGLTENKKKLKIINIKLQKPKNNGGGEVLKPLQTSEEMLKKIRNSLDDDNLKGMLNFSYENFLSKESERDSKEYSIEN